MPATPPTTPTNPGYVTGAMVSVEVDNVLVYAKGGSFARSAVEIKVNNSREGCYQVVAPGLRSGVLNLDLAYNGSSPAPPLEEGQYVLVLLDSVGASCVPAGLEGRVFTVPGMITSLTDSWTNDGEYGWSVVISTHGQWMVVEPAPTP